MKRAVFGLLALLIGLGVLVLSVPSSPPEADAPALAHAPQAAPAAPEVPSLAPPAAEPSAPRGTTWLVLKVGSASSELVTTIHKDALPYAPGPATADAGAVRFRLLEADGGELSGPCSWPRLCRCEAAADHHRGCVRIPHSGSVRVRLPRVLGPSRLVIERRDARGWTPLTELELDA